MESWAIALNLLQAQFATTRLSDFVDIAARLGHVPAVPQLPEQAAEPAPETTPQDAAAEEPPMELLAEEPEPGWPVPDWSQPSAMIDVYPDASGQKPTLHEALRDAPAKACLVLHPGDYRESMVIKRDLQIRSDGDPREVIIESLTTSVVSLEGACLYLGQLTLKGVGGKDKRTLPAIEVKSGHLVMEDCDLTSDISTVVDVKGERSEAILRRCHLHDGKAGGIVFHEGGVGYLEDCHLYQNKLSQVAIGKGCSPTLVSCKISHALMAGIYISEGGEGFIENCDIWGNAVGGVQIRRGGNPRFRYCRISANERYGILIAEQGEGLFEQCQVFDNARMGVSISQQGKPRFAGCQVSTTTAKASNSASRAKASCSTAKSSATTKPMCCSRTSRSRIFTAASSTTDTKPASSSRGIPKAISSSANFSPMRWRGSPSRKMRSPFFRIACSTTASAAALRCSAPRGNSPIAK